MTQARKRPGGSSARRLRIPAAIARTIDLDSDRVDRSEPIADEDIGTPGVPDGNNGGNPENPPPDFRNPLGSIPVPTFVLDSNGNVAINPTFVVRNGQLLVDVEIDINEVGLGYTYEVRFT